MEDRWKRGRGKKGSKNERPNETPLKRQANRNKPNRQAEKGKGSVEKEREMYTQRGE